jgi:hypothetical protein
VNADGVVEDVPEAATTAHATPPGPTPIASAEGAALASAEPMTNPMEAAPTGAAKPNS